MVQLGQSPSRPDLVGEPPGEPAMMPPRRGVARPPAARRETAGHSERGPVHLLRQRAEDGLALVDPVARDQHGALRLAEQLADDDAGVAVGDPPASGPVQTRSTRSLGCGREARSAARRSSIRARCPGCNPSPCSCCRSRRRPRPRGRGRSDGDGDPVGGQEPAGTKGRARPPGRRRRVGRSARSSAPPRRTRPPVLDGRDDQGAVEEVVVLLARGLGDQQAAVAGGTVQEAALVGSAGRAGRRPGRSSRAGPAPGPPAGGGRSAGPSRPGRRACPRRRACRCRAGCRSRSGRRRPARGWSWPGSRTPATPPSAAGATASAA